MVEVDKTTIQEWIYGRMGKPTGVIEVPKTLLHESVEVAKTTLQGRISERSQVIEVPKISCRERAEVAESIPQDRLSERCQEVEVPMISCRERAEAAILQRTVEQYLDTGHKTASHRACAADS